MKCTVVCTVIILSIFLILYGINYAKKGALFPSGIPIPTFFAFLFAPLQQPECMNEQREQTETVLFFCLDVFNLEGDEQDKM